MCLDSSTGTGVTLHNGEEKTVNSENREGSDENKNCLQVFKKNMVIEKYFIHNFNNKSYDTGFF